MISLNFYNPFLVICSDLPLNIEIFGPLFLLFWPKSAFKSIIKVRILYHSIFTPLCSVIVSLCCTLPLGMQLLGPLFPDFQAKFRGSFATRQIVELIEHHHLIFIPLSLVIISIVLCPSFGHANTLPSFAAFSGQTQSTFWRQEWYFVLESSGIDCQMSLHFHTFF